MDHLQVEVIGVELQGVDSISHHLGLLAFSVLISFDIHEVKFAVSVPCKTGDFSLLPGLPVALDRRQGETLLVIGELAILTKSVETDDVLLLEGLERFEFDLLPVLVLFLVFFASLHLLLLDCKLGLFVFGLLLSLLFSLL